MSETPAVEVRLIVNGHEVTARVHPMARLLDVLRHELRLTGTKEGCGEGECGACSVLVDGELANSCLMPVLQADGRAVTTIEGVALAGSELHAVQQAFVEHGGAQCGICTPGMVLAALNLLERHPYPTEANIRAGLAGNLCRCTGYTRIFEAVARAAETRQMAKGRASP
jgi:aerobic carbon-monoxide dehydrogenase small subunit